MTLTLVSTFGSAGSGWADQENGSPGSVSVAVTNANVGDLVVTMMVCVTGDLPASISDSNSRITWDNSAMVSVASDGNGFATAMWKGVVASTGTTSITPSGTNFYGFYAGEIHESTGSPAWTVAASNSNNGSGATATWPNLTSNTVTDQCYIGGLLLDGSPSVGTTSGFSWLKTATLPSILTWNLALSTSSSYQPTCSNGSGAWDTVGAIFSAGAPASFAAPPAKVVDQAVRRAVYY